MFKYLTIYKLIYIIMIKGFNRVLNMCYLIITGHILFCMHSYN